MKKFFLLYCFLFASSIALLAQLPEQYASDVKMQANSDTSKKRKFLISSSSFRKVTKTIFGQLATGQTSAGVVSNFASLDVTQGKFNFNGSLPLGNRFFLTAALAGDIDNNIGQLFSNFKLNNNTSIDLRLNFRIPHGTTFYYTEGDRSKLEKQQWKIQNQYLIDSSKIEGDSSIAEIKLKLLNYIKDSLEKRIATLSTNTKSRESKFTNPDGSYTSSEPDRENFKNSLRELLQAQQLFFEAKKNYDSLKYSIDRKNEYYKILKDAAKKKRKEALEVSELSADWNAIKVQWLSLRISPTRSKFWMVDTLLPYSSQVFDTVLTNAYYGLEYSFYFYSRRQGFTHYFNIGAGFSKTDNRKKLDAYDVTDTWKRDSGRISRNYSSKVNAYNGVLTEDESWFFYGNYYLFFSNKTALGFHFFPDIETRKGYSPQYNVGAGLVFSFKKKGEEKTIINAEPYFRLTDLTDVLDKGSATFRRNEIGIRVGLPFNPDGARKKD